MAQMRIRYLPWRVLCPSCGQHMTTSHAAVLISWHLVVSCSNEKCDDYDIAYSVEMPSIDAKVEEKMR